LIPEEKKRRFKLVKTHDNRVADSFYMRSNALRTLRGVKTRLNAKKLLSFKHTVKLSNLNKFSNRTELIRTNSILSRRTVREIFRIF